MRTGYTLIELLLALAILGSLAVIGWGTTRGYLPRFRMMDAARSFRSDLQELRGLAMETNLETRLHLVSSGGSCDDGETWGGVWRLEVGNRSRGSDRWELLPIDAVGDGVDDEQGLGIIDLGPGGDHSLKGVCLADWADLHGPGVGSEDSIVFSPRGWLSNPFEDFNSEGWIEVGFINQEARLRGVTDEVTVLVSRAGLVRLQSSLGDPFAPNPVGTGSASTAR